MNRRLPALLIAVASLIWAGDAPLRGQDGSKPPAVAAPSVPPKFLFTPGWPIVPKEWVLGPASSVAVDRRSNVWLLTRPRLVPAAYGQAAPAVVQLDPTGKFMQAWGGPGTGYQWPANEHGIYVDDSDQVWITGNGTGDHVVLKFSNAGKLLLQIGKQDAGTGNKDTGSLNMPADVFVHSKTNEVFVADGYGNRRVIVFDAATGAYKRMWGAFGNAPAGDRPKSPASIGSPAGPGQPQPVTVNPADVKTPQFDLVHSVAVANDGMVYVADPTGRRVQVFTIQGKYVSQVLINEEGPAPQSAVALAFSPDPAQRFLFVADTGNSQIVFVERKSLNPIGFIGDPGDFPGHFQGLHDIAIDSSGTVYTAEVSARSRFQRFSVAPAEPAK